MAATNDDASASLTDVVLNFGTAHAATQESLRTNTASIMAIQGQLQMLCQAVGNGQPPPSIINYQQCPRGGRGRGQQRGGNNSGGGSYGGGRYNGGGGNNHGGGGANQNINGSGGGGGGEGSYNNSNQNANGGGGYNGGSGTNGGGYGIGNQNLSGQSPTPIKCFDNWNYCSTHGGNLDNNHTSATCARPGENYQCAATRTNTMGGSLRSMHKTILSSTIGRQAAPMRPPPAPVNYTPTFFHPLGNIRPRFPMTPGSWGFGPHAGAYQWANNIPPPLNVVLQ